MSTTTAPSPVRTGCSATINHEHYIEWMLAPGLVHYVNATIEISNGAMYRGFCWNCNQIFTEEV